MRITRRDDVGVHIQVRCSDLRGDSTVGGLVLTLRDVTEQRQLEEELKHRAFHDALTGLPNRLLFQDRAAHGLVRTHRDGTTAGVLFVDLDDFKIVNDTMGHSVGDELLVAAGIRLSSVVRDSDMAARLGGDEFALLVEDVADSAAVEALRRAHCPGVRRALRSRRRLGDLHGHGRRRHHGGQRGRGRTAPPCGPGPVRREGGRQAAVAPLPARAERRNGQAARDPGRARRRGEELCVHPRLPAHRGADQR